MEMDDEWLLNRTFLMDVLRMVNDLNQLFFNAVFIIFLRIVNDLNLVLMVLLIVKWLNHEFNTTIIKLQYSTIKTRIV